ncbi:MAG TPA: multiheme c-type cytochrome [Opitutaceae bacterium]|nr:multiheme c-type cytochrome [Opitutaceae bacterium]
MLRAETLGWVLSAALIGATLARAQSYVGDQACSTCHQEKSTAYHHTAHAKTSGRATKESIHGSFAAGANILRTANPNLYFQMEARGAEFFQTGVLRTSPSEVLTRSERFDLVVGSGRKGQTYLFWDGDGLFQLPVSYWTELGSWVNSPGYVDGTANFDRPIPARCLECHGSSFESRAPPENVYNKTSLVLGISCEKCHGPGGEHVARYRSASPPRSGAETAIVNPAKLSRERQMDSCSLCHAGAGHSLTPPLSFTPGQVLANHVMFPKLPPDAPMDVHASQVQLLERSRCFQASPTMTCTTCHDVHQPQRDPEILAAKCLTCHQVESCPTFPKLGQKIISQCATCHMPLQDTAQIIISVVNGKNLQPKVRNHHIAIYPGVQLPAAKAK